VIIEINFPSYPAVILGDSKPHSRMYEQACERSEIAEESKRGIRAGFRRLRAEIFQKPDPEASSNSVSWRRLAFPRRKSLGFNHRAERAFRKSHRMSEPTPHRRSRAEPVGVSDRQSSRRTSHYALRAGFIFIHRRCDTARAGGPHLNVALRDADAPLLRARITHRFIERNK